jgi:hypothetical protein
LCTIINFPIAQNWAHEKKLSDMPEIIRQKPQKPTPLKMGQALHNFKQSDYHSVINALEINFLIYP